MPAPTSREILEDIYDQMRDLEILPTQKQLGAEPMSLEFVLKNLEAFEATVKKYRKAVREKKITPPKNTPCGKTPEQWIRDRIGDLV